MSVNCEHCARFNRTEERCDADLWDRNEDEFLSDDDEYIKYIGKPRFCSEFKDQPQEGE